MGLLRKLSLLFGVFVFIGLFLWVSVYIFPPEEGKHSLLDFTCEQLERGKITRDARGLLVAYSGLDKRVRVENDLILDAMVRKGCLANDSDLKYSSRAVTCVPITTGRRPHNLNIKIDQVSDE